MSRNHPHNDPQQYNKAFAFGILLNVVYITVEIIYGLLINSLALLADAGHNVSDVLGLLLAWLAAYLSTRKPTNKRTYGYSKTSVLAAFLNALILMIAIGAIIWEAVGRFSAPKAVDSGTVMIVAGVGVIINGITAWLFFAGRKDDLNIKGAFLHMAADAAVSAGVVIGGLIILQTGSYWIDPVLSIIIAVVIFISTWNLLRDSFNLAIDAVPPEIDQRRVYEYFNNLKEVTGVHDLHIWAMSTTDTALTVHLVIPGDIEVDSFLNKINIDLHDSFGIEHPTIQIEKKTDNDCIELH